MNAVTRGLEDWQLDFGTICLRAFPQLQKPRYTDIAHARTDQAYRYWTLARDEEPVICLSIDAIVIDASNGY